MFIEKLGEFGLIKRFKERLNNDSSVVRDSGDDCAVLRLDRKMYQLFTCDMLVEGVDFTSRDNPYFIGRKALAVSISDIAACGGIPRYAVVSLGLPRNLTVNKVDKIAGGIFDLAAKYRINIVGGDISKASRIVIDVSMLGVVEKTRLCLRSKARRGDIIFVSGALGGSLHGKHLTFEPRIKESRFLVEHFKINSMIDISDGLAQDLWHILEESGVSAVLYESLIPINKEASGINSALYNGEDFELLFTVSRAEAKKISAAKRYRFFPIGEVVSGGFGLSMVDRNNRERKIIPGGYRHF
ncbi:MAG: thiamine-phosphate kinase [Candidatus Omnitrophica bacterium]|nr:thiamine-phosphate kinase [Candidatus Omnitrophota bacterium]